MKSEIPKGLTSTSVWKNFFTSTWITIRLFCSFKIICRAVQRSENKSKITDCQRHLEDSSEELQHSNYLQIQKYFTLARLVLLVTNIMSDDDHDHVEDNDHNHDNVILTLGHRGPDDDDHIDKSDDNWPQRSWQSAGSSVRWRLQRCQSVHSRKRFARGQYES